MKKEDQREIYADVLERLVEHLQKRTDVQNIDLMNLSGFCRNCLSKWYVAAAEKRNYHINYDDARSLIYGMPYQEWKDRHQTKASKEQLDAFEKNKS